MNNNEQIENIATIARTIGAKCDEKLSEGRSLTTNVLQKFMMTHPKALYAIKTIIENDELLAYCREALKGDDVIHDIYKSDRQEHYGRATEEQQQEYISMFEAALDCCRMDVRIMDGMTSDPQRLARHELYDSLNNVVWMMREAQCKHLQITPPILHQYDAGRFVSIRPCGEEYGDKTYLGILIGSFPLSAGFRKVENDPKALDVVFTYENPAIYVPELKRTIFGAESFWSEIESPEDLKEITDADINDVWYVKALKELESHE